MGPSPSKVGKYSIVGVLGRGGSEDVYLGEYAGRRVAIRLFSSVSGPEKERLVEEARKIAGLSHANIAFQEVGVHEDQPFLVAEMSGTNLETWLGEDPTLADQLAVIEGICAGLTYAHGHGVLHRMLTTGSVLVTPDGEARIWNFGLAKLKPEKSVSAYVAPEILEGQPATPQSDIYSAGVVSYEILTGVAPVAGEQGVAKPIREIRAETPRDLSDAIMACRERAPDWRPKDLSYLLEVVRKLRGGAGPKTPKPAAAPAARAATPAPRGRASSGGGPPIALIAVGAALVLGGAAFYFTRAGKSAPVAQNVVPATAPTTTLAAAPETTLAAMTTPSSAPTARPTPIPTAVAPSSAPVSVAKPTPTPTIAPTVPPTTAAAARATPPPLAAPTTTLPPAPTPAPTTTMAPAPGPTAAAAHGVPLLRALSPPMLKRGQTMLVDVRGSDLNPQLAPTLLKAKGGVATGLRVARQRYVNDTTIQVFIEVEASAAPGQYAIVLSDGSMSTNTLRIDVAK